MDALALKLQRLKYDLQVTTNRAEENEKRLRTANARAEEAENLTKTLRQHLENSKKELEAINIEIESKEEKMLKLRDVCDHEEEIVEKLMKKELKSMDEEEELESMIKEATDFGNTIQMEYEAAVRKYKSMNERKELRQKDLQTFSAREDELKEQLEKWTEEFKKHKKDRAKQNAKQRFVQKRYYDLKGHCADAEIRLEVAERASQLLESEVGKLGKELEEIRISTNKMEEELNGFVEIINDE